MDNTTSVGDKITDVYGMFSNQVAGLANQYGPKAMDYAVNFAHATALIHVIQMLMFFGFSSLVLLISGICCFKTKDTDAQNFFLMLIIGSSVLTFISILTIVGHVWDFVGLVHPELYIGHILLETASHRSSS